LVREFNGFEIKRESGNLVEKRVEVSVFGVDGCEVEGGEVLESME
jgi:hypothetical protein